MVAIGRKRSAAPGMACEAGSEADIALLASLSRPMSADGHEGSFALRGDLTR